MQEQRDTGGATDIYQEDEISVTDLLRKLWRRRGLLIAFPAVFLLLAAAFIFFSAVRSSTPVTYFVQLQGIEKSTYPNGARFSPQDLLISEVLSCAAKPLQIPVDKGLRNAIQVEYGVPTTVGIKKKYQKLLASNKLTSAEISELNKVYQEELQRVSERGLRITVDYNTLGLTQEQGVALANALPRAWTKIYTEKYRVFIDTRLDSVAVVRDDNPLNSTSDILLARNTLTKIKHGLELLSKDTRLKALVSQGGFSSSDLQSRFQRFNNIYFRVIFNAAFSTPDEVAASFITETRLKIGEIERNIEELNRSLKDIQSLRTKSLNRLATDNSRDSIQFGENTLNQVIQLADQASLSDYLRKILTERRELVAQKASLETDLSRAEAKRGTERDDILWNHARSELSSLKNEYISLLVISRNTRQQSYGDFYKPLGSPDVLTSIVPPRAILLLIMSIFLGGGLGIMVALVWPERKKLGDVL